MIVLATHGTSTVIVGILHMYIRIHTIFEQNQSFNGRLRAADYECS